jgi:hypothetical protein
MILFGKNGGVCSKPLTFKTKEVNKTPCRNDERKRNCLRARRYARRKKREEPEKLRFVLAVAREL